MARIRKENVAIPHQEVDILINFDKSYYCAFSVNLTCILNHPLFRDIFSYFMQTGRTLQGKHIDAVGPYSFQISDYIMYESLWHYLTVISKILFREFPSNIHSMIFLYPRWRAKSHIQGVPGGKDLSSGECSLGQTITIYPKTPISKVQWLRRYWPEKFETLTAVTHLLITKYMLKLAGICGFCNVNVCT